MSDQAALLEIKAGLLRSLAAVNAELGIEQDDKNGKPLSISDLDEAVMCRRAAFILRMNPRNFIRSLRDDKNGGVVVVKHRGKLYCQTKDIVAIWPRFADELEKRKPKY